MSQLTLIEVPIDNDSYRNALIEFNKYKPLKEYHPIAIIQCLKTNTFQTWWYVGKDKLHRMEVKYKKSFKIVMSTDKLN